MSRRPQTRKAAGSPAPALRPAALAGWAAVGALLLVVLAAPQVASLLGRGDASAGEVRYATGYTQIIDSVFAPMGWLVRHEATDDTGTAQTQVVTLSDSAYRNEVIWNFYRQSFLRGDVLADDAKLWKFDGPAVTGIEPWTHAEPGPFQAVRIWRGDITYRDEAASRPGLTWEGGEASFQESADPADWSGLPSLSTDGKAEQGAGFSGGVRFVNETGDNLAAAIPVGQALLLRVLPNASASVAVNGKPIIPPSDGAAYLALQPGDAISFVRNGAPLGRTFIVRVASASISHFEPFTERQRDPAMTSLAVALETAMNGAAQEGAATGLEPGVTTLRTTLSRGLQENLQQLLVAGADQVKADTGGHDFPAAATVMVTTTGEVLALASYPTHPSPGASTPPPNYNFKLLPIGSVAKVPFSSSILSAHPGLQALVIKGAGGDQFRTLFGIDLKTPLPEDASAAQVDFPTFLIQSSNKYASTLLLLSSARDPFTPDGPATPETYDLHGAQTHLPRIAFHERPDKATGSGVPVDGLAGPLSAVIAPDGGASWITRLATAYDLPNAEKLAGDVNLYDYSDWGELTRGWDDAALRALADVSPERESFGLNAIGDLRDDYLSLILGGGRSRWSTLRVAEVFSRLVTRKAVTPVLYLQSQPTGFPAVQGLDGGAIDAVLGALEQVPKIGTARAISGALKPLQDLAAARGETIRVFAKTGTPRLQRPYRSPANRATDALIRLRYLGLQKGYLRLVGGAPGATMAQVFAHEDRIREELAEERVSAGDVIAYIRHLNDDLSPSDRAASLAIGPDGQLAGLTADQNTEPYSGGVLAFVIGRYRNGCPIVSPVRALTVVINVQQKSKAGGAVNPAILLTQRLFSSAAFQSALFPATPAAAAPAAGGCG